MSKISLLAAMTCLLFASWAGAADEAVDRIIVQWKPGVSATEGRDAHVRAVGDRAAARIQRAHGIGSRMEVLRLEDGARGLDAALRELRSDPDVEFAVPDRRVRVHAFTPNDPLFPQQWYLGTTDIAATRAVNAWDLTLGAPSVVVAVIDTGVRFEHPDLKAVADGGKLLPGYDFISGDRGGTFATANDGNGWDADPSDPGDFISAADLQSDLFRGKKCGGGDTEEEPTDSSWHGTRVSGLIAASSNNAEGVTGTGFNIRVLPVRALGKCGGYDSDVLSAMYWSAGLSIPPTLLSGSPPANPNPARIINMSLGGVGACTAAYSQAVRDITAAGVLIVASAGNEGGPVDSPGNCPGVLAVAGVRHVGTKVGYSNVGTEVALAAPAGNCFNTAPGSACLYQLTTTTNAGTQAPAGSTYTSPTARANVGTSFSSPLVAASAGLMLAVNPKLTPTKLSARLKETTRAFPTTSDTSPLPPTCHVPTSSSDVQNSECLCTTATCGAGLLDTGAAVSAAFRPVAIATTSGQVGLGRTVTLDGSASGAANGRTIVTYAWSVLSATGGATQPLLAAPDAAVTTMLSPSAGTVTLRLTVTDGAGASDTADVTIQAATSGGAVSSSSAPAAAPEPSGGGGGALDVLTLLTFALVLAVAACHRNRHARRA